MLQLDNFESADFKYEHTVFKFEPKNIQIMLFWSHIQAFLSFHEILQLSKIDRIDFKYNNAFFQIPK